MKKGKKDPEEGKGSEEKLEEGNALSEDAASLSLGTEEEETAKGKHSSQKKNNGMKSKTESKNLESLENKETSDANHRDKALKANLNEGASKQEAAASDIDPKQFSLQRAENESSTQDFTDDSAETATCVPHKVKNLIVILT